MHWILGILLGLFNAYWLQERKIVLADRSERVTPQELDDSIKRGEALLIVDVRSPIEFEMCNIPGSINMTLKDLEQQETRDSLKERWNNLNSRAAEDGKGKSSGTKVNC